MGKIFDSLKKDNPGLDSHAMNVFMARLLFCFFAEDSGIFEEERLFTDFIERATAPDGSDLREQLERAAQQLRSEGAIHRRAGTAGSQPHRPALGQTGSQQALALCLGQIFSQRQFPRRNGRTKGGKLCFHILAA